MIETTVCALQLTALTCSSDYISMISCCLVSVIKEEFILLTMCVDCNLLHYNTDLHFYITAQNAYTEK